ncbi:UNVERIFIED_CONTAM: hypothetical protein H355_012512 [Colinus virginianus]|nr:hypothetical protein H355_012512 [Colinus virginianus]
MLEEAGEVLESVLKASCLPLSFLLFVPAVLLLLGPPPAAEAAHEFTVYRMQQYELGGQPYGTRSAVLNTEARTVEADVLSRRCVMMRLLDFSYEQYQKALRQSAGAVVIILPRSISSVPQDVVKQFMEIEPEMLAMETIVPVYFAVEDDELLSIYEQTRAASASQGSASAAEGESSYNLLFFASGGGKFNYQGTKRWLEDNLDHTDLCLGGVEVPAQSIKGLGFSVADSSLLQDNVAFVLCLDTLGQGNSLHLHVSKPPKEGTLQHAFLRELEMVVASQFPEVKFSMVHKKINLAEDMLAWEHERFAIRRLPAFTISHLESHRDSLRNSIMDRRSEVDTKALTRNTRIIAEALTRVIYNLTEKGAPADLQIFTDQMQVQQEQLESVMDWLSSQPRAAQLIDKDSTFLSTLEYYMGRYLKDVKQHHVKADKRDPEFVFYDQLKQVMNAYRVKPAIFDLLLAVCIAAYLGVTYVAVQNFGLLYRTIQRLSLKTKQQ